MTSNKRYLLIIGAVVGLAVLAALGWFVYQRTHTGYTMNDNGGTTLTTGGMHVMSDKQPSLDRNVSYQASLPADAKTLLVAKIASTTAALKKNPADYGSWLNLALDYKMAGDYTAARDVWEYLSEAAPTQSVSYLDLGNLYALYLKDYPKAEQNYKLAIKINPRDETAYLGLHDMYQYSYKTDTSAAVDILTQGMDTLGSPKNIDLVIALAQYYKEHGDTAKAKEYFQQARGEALDLKNTQLVTNLSNELNSLK